MSSVTFVPLGIIVYPVILSVNLPYPFLDFNGGLSASALQAQRYMNFELCF
jgi:hypothetical protein